MKPPPFLLGAALLFWGWQTGLLLPGALMGFALEGARWLKARWEFSDQDFSRIWIFCSLLLLVSSVFAFSQNRGVAEFSEFFQNPSLVTQRNVGTASARTAAAMFRWLPMIFFLFVGAQVYSGREGIPLEAISLILRRRMKKARQLGWPLPPSRSVNVGYPYFALCLLAASVHAAEDSSFFWGLFALLAWALWTQRSRRFGLLAWTAALAIAVAGGYFGQRGISQLQRYLDNLSLQWPTGPGRRRFNPKRALTDLGRAGELKLSGTIVLRLETPAEKPPPLLREASYRIFRRRSWLAETTTNDWREISSTEPNGTTYVLFPGKTNLASLNIGCYLEGGNDLLPLPSGTARLENLMAIELQRNPLGAVLDKGPGLVVFDALYGPGQTIDDPANTNLDQTVTNLDETVANLEETITNRAVTNLDLVVPRRERPALDLVIAQLHLQGQSRKQVLRTLSAFFTDQFTYSTRPNPLLPLSTNETALSRFLLEERRGHCEYFATAGVLLLRRLGIPARYAVGYAVHEGSGRKFVVRQRDAHAWCLVWNESANIWQDFDPTPPSWIQAEAKPLSAWQALSDFWSRLRFEVSKIWWGQTHLRQYLLAIVVPILLLLFYQIVFRRRRRRQEGKAAAAAVIAWPGLDSEFYQLELKLAGLGLARQPSEPLSEWLQRAVEAPALASFREPLKALLRLHYRYRFDPLGLGREEREELRREAKACLEKVGDSRVMRDA